MYYKKEGCFYTYNVPQIMARIDSSKLSEGEKTLAKSALFIAFTMAPRFGRKGLDLSLGKEKSQKAYYLLMEMFGQGFMEGMFSGDPDGFFLNFGEWENLGRDFARSLVTPCECLAMRDFKRLCN